MAIASRKSASVVSVPVPTTAPFGGTATSLVLAYCKAGKSLDAAWRQVDCASGPVLVAKALSAFDSARSALAAHQSANPRDSVRVSSGVPFGRAESDRVVPLSCVALFRTGTVRAQRKALA